MTIYILGDSFADQYTPENTWMQQVADSVGHTPVFLGKGGTSLDYTYKAFNEIRGQITETDIVIVALTDLSRRWFLPEKPQTTVWMTLNEGGEKGKAVEQFLRYLENDQVYITYLMNFMYNLEYLARDKGIRIVILPCFDYVAEELQKQKKLFPSLHIANKSLVRISVEEFEDGLERRMGMLREGLDIRYSHLLRSNHNVLAAKIIANIKENEPICLKTGFTQKFLTPEILCDLEFSKQELFNAHMLAFYPEVIDRLRKC